MWKEKAPLTEVLSVWLEGLGWVVGVRGRNEEERD